MTVNLMKQYTNLTQKQINTYMKMVFGSKIEKKYLDAYTNTYINVRYNNFYDNNTNNTATKNILEKLKETQENLIINNIEDRELIEKIRIFYYYVLYFDNVVYYKDLESIIQKIHKLRKKILNKSDELFQEKLLEKMETYIEDKQRLLLKTETPVFYLKISNYEYDSNVYRVNLKYNIEFPVEYSNYAIEKAFTQGITNEDRLLVEYYLITTHVIKDILKANFKRKYILEFNNKLLKKPKKLKNLLNIIEYNAIQEKVSLKIRYEYFLENKSKIYELMQEGFKFTIILDNSFDVNYKNIEDLKMFEFVILNKNMKTYKEIIEYKKNLENVLEV